MDERTRTELIERYRSGPAEVDAVWASLSSDQQDRRPEPGEWTAREICHHLADSEATSYIRLRKLLAEDEPQITGYDENLFAKTLHYDRPVDASLAVLRAVRASSAELLGLLDETDWQRVGTHTESGAYSVATWLETYAAHAHDHADQMRRAAGVA